MTHKHRCSNGHIWEHGPTPHSLQTAEWEKTNNAMHTCPTCGQEKVFKRYLDQAEITRQEHAAYASGQHNAGLLLKRLEEISPEIEPAELIATVAWFTRVGLLAYRDYHQAKTGKNVDLTALWKTLGDDIKEGTKTLK